MGLASILRSRDHSANSSSGESWCTLELHYSLADTPPPSRAPLEVPTLLGQLRCKIFCCWHSGHCLLRSVERDTLLACA